MTFGFYGKTGLRSKERRFVTVMRLCTVQKSIRRYQRPLNHQSSSFKPAITTKVVLISVEDT